MRAWAVVLKDALTILFFALPPQPPNPEPKPEGCGANGLQC